MDPERERSSASWWSHVPLHERPQRRGAVWLLRLRRALGSRSFLIRLLFTAYAVICLSLLLSGMGVVALVAVLPLLLVPPIGALAYWLLWKEFHH
jgi:hypothetical protein